MLLNNRDVKISPSPAGCCFLKLFLANLIIFLTLIIQQHIVHQNCTIVQCTRAHITLESLFSDVSEIMSTLRRWHLVRF